MSATRGQKTRGSMDETNEDMHPPAPVDDSMIPFPRSQILIGGLTSLWWWQATAQVSKAAHDCLLHPIPEVMPVMRGSWACVLWLAFSDGIFRNDGFFLDEGIFLHESLFLQDIPRGDICKGYTLSSQQGSPEIMLDTAGGHIPVCPRGRGELKSK